VEFLKSTTTSTGVELRRRATGHPKGVINGPGFSRAKDGIQKSPCEADVEWDFRVKEHQGKNWLLHLVQCRASTFDVKISFVSVSSKLKKTAEALYVVDAICSSRFQCNRYKN